MATFRAMYREPLLLLEHVMMPPSKRYRALSSCRLLDLLDQRRRCGGHGLNGRDVHPEIFKSSARYGSWNW
ncbi:MAG: hypothetical protein R3B46_00975 [Phycisphaerales bacterium]